MNIEELIKLFPKESAILIAVTFSSLGWIIRNIVEIILENYKFKREKRTFLWKEKLNAAKKASEFYVEYINFLNLCRLNFNLYKTKKIGSSKMIEFVNNELVVKADKLNQFPHFEYHHINIFFEVINEENMLINNENYDVILQINELAYNKKNDNEKLDLLLEKLIKNYEILYKNAINQLNTIRLNLLNEF